MVMNSDTEEIVMVLRPLPYHCYFTNDVDNVKMAAKSRQCVVAVVSLHAYIRHSVPKCRIT